MDDREDRELVTDPTASQDLDKPISTTLTVDEFRRLVALAGDLHDDATPASEGSCWRAAIFLLGSSIEAAILAMACAFEQRLWSKEARPDLLRLELGRLIRLAIDQAWLPVATAIDEGGTQADMFSSLEGDVGDAVRFLLDVRNMAVHPGRYIRSEVVPDFFDDEQMKQTFDLLAGITGAVFEKLHDALAILP